MSASARTITVYSVGHNVPGYLPESAPYLSRGWEIALHRYASEIREATVGVARTDDCLCGYDSGGELCELCSLEAQVAAHIRDDVSPALRTPGLEITITLRGESSATEEAHWVTAVDMTPGEYAAARLQG